jgi:hypothetical protein
MTTSTSLPLPRAAVAVASALLLVTAAACDQVKSSNPLSPYVAGPMAGVTISAPRPLTPQNGSDVQDRDQPLNVLIENPASNNSPRAVTMEFQIGTDAGFSAVVYSTGGLALGDGGRTSYRLPNKLQSGRTYYWRARAGDGANISPWSTPAQFQLLNPIVIGIPVPQSPINNTRVGTTTPQFVVGNGQSSGPHNQLAYNFQITDNSTFGTLVTNAWVNEDPSGQTKYTMPPLPAYDRTFYWRVKISDGQNTGAWSSVASFRSPLAPAPGPSPSPGPAPGTGKPGSCASNDGPTIVNCIGAKYPDRLAAGVSSSQRQANMEFLRDRIIEAGICGGLDLGWNLKRGGPEISSDFITMRVNGVVHGIDIGHDYDNTSIPLELQWSEGDFPTYGAYPPFSCGGT